MGGLYMSNEEGIPNLAAEFKSDNIWPPFGQKKTVESRDFLGIFEIKILDSTVFWPKRVSNVILFEVRGQIRKPLVILHILGRDLI